MDERPKPYNPLDRVELAKSVERALLSQPMGGMPPAMRFSGAGLYAIYYLGPVSPYRRLSRPSEVSDEIPIYVGRAQAKGARRGIVESLDATTTGTALYDRLAEHARSIGQVQSHATEMRARGKVLRVEDFRCRYLVADDIWVPLGEALLIARYRPVWNVVVDGFGNHSPGEGRTGQARSPWDELHPGRAWAFTLRRAKHTTDEIELRVRNHLATFADPGFDAVPAIDEQVQTALAYQDDAETDLG